MPKNRKVVFVAHDFSTEGNHRDRFRKAIRVALRGFRCRADYADVNLLADHNLSNIIKKIRAAHFTIIDLTNYHSDRRGGVNLNAVFEYGIAVGMGRRTIMVFKGGNLNVARDFSDVTTFIYEAYTTYTDLSHKLKQRVASMVKRLD